MQVDLNIYLNVFEWIFLPFFFFILIDDEDILEKNFDYYSN